MGNIKQGILGGFSGKVGTVIGYGRKGKAFMRAKALSIKNPNTLSQQVARKKFAILSNALSTMAEAIRVGFHNQAHNGRTELNAAFSFNYNRALSEMGGMVKLNYDSLVVSRGNLAPCKVTFTPGDGATIDASWVDNSGVMGAQSTDILNVIVYNPDKGMSVQRVGIATRQDEGVSFDTIPDWNNQEVHVYAFWSSKKEVSDNTYVQLSLK